MPTRIGDALRWHATYTPKKTAIVSLLYVMEDGASAEIAVTWWIPVSFN